MAYINKTSLLVPSQLPQYIRETPDYQNFVLFLQAYYEWMESKNTANSQVTVAGSTQQGPTYAAKNLLNYADIDNTLDDFVQYYLNDFMTFFPKTAMTNPVALAKIIKTIYQTKGNPSSYKFLFRTLYNSDVETYNTKDFILKASDGKWVATEYVVISTTDFNWLNSIGFRLFGKTSKAYATIERVLVGDTSTQIILTNIVRDFVSGETVIPVDAQGAPVQVNNLYLESQILGTLEGVTPDPVVYGNFYEIGDPVVFYGGLNPEIRSAKGASAHISTISGATIKGVNVIYGGQGYIDGLINVQIYSATSGDGRATAVAKELDTSNPYSISLVSTDVIGNTTNVVLGSSNWNASKTVFPAAPFGGSSTPNLTSKIVSVLNRPTLTTYPIKTVAVVSGGSGYDLSTKAFAEGSYYANGTNNLQLLSSLGILAPIQIAAGGRNYQVNDKIIFTDGTGIGANAYVTSVNATGAIVAVSYFSAGANTYPLGGMGYTNQLPTLSVSSLNGTGASLTIPGIVGSDAQFTLQQTLVGSVLGIELDDPGTGYIAPPSVSLRVSDVLVSNVSPQGVPQKGDIVYQGAQYGTASYSAFIDSATVYTANTVDPLSSVYNVRLYDYNGTIDINTSFNVLRDGSTINIILPIVKQNTSLISPAVGSYVNGVKQYGNGSAKATAKFVGGVAKGQGTFVNSDGQPSGYSVLQNQDYNNYTYLLQVEKSLAEYKNAALKFLHPAGMNYRAVNVVKDEQSYDLQMYTNEMDVVDLNYIIQSSTGYVANMNTNSNTVQLSGMTNENLQRLVVGSYFVYNANGNITFYSQITGVNATSKLITLDDNFVNYVPNVATASVSANSTVINISDVTKATLYATGYDVANSYELISGVTPYDYVSFDGVNFKSVISINPANAQLAINSAFDAVNSISGMLHIKKNMQTSNVQVSTLVLLQDIFDLYTEDGQQLVSESGDTLIIG